MKVFNAKKYEWLGVVRIPAFRDEHSNYYPQRYNYVFQCTTEGFSPELVLVNCAKIIYDDTFVYLDSYLLDMVRDFEDEDAMITPDHFINSLSVKCLGASTERLAVNESNIERRLNAYGKSLAKIESKLRRKQRPERHVLHSVS